ncbi:glycosylase [Psychrobacillus sp. NPDC096389]|uniref:glycosylase n=1 Tax=Psychrobacillus sp. NPDC096389 TaxID=3364490 RepID=UPI003829BD10
MFKWEKKGVIFNPLTQSKYEWMYEFAQAPCVLEKDDFIRVYFNTREKIDKNGQYKSYVAFIDLDKTDLKTIKGMSESPLLTLGGLGTFDEFGTYPFTIYDDKDNEKVIAYYGGWTRCESVPFDVSIGMAISNDGGNTFVKYGKGPVLTSTPYEPFIISGPKIRKFKQKYYLFYIAGCAWIEKNSMTEPVYKIRLAVSEDGVNWEKYNKNIIEDKLHEFEAQASPDVFYKDGYYHMFFCYRDSHDYRTNSSNAYRIGYAYSKDLFNWTRRDNLVGIDVSKEGFDNEMVAYPHVFEVENKIYMFYLGNEVGKYGFGIAELIDLNDDFLKEN